MKKIPLYPNRDFIDFNEAAAYLRISKAKLYYLTSHHLIPFYKPVGRKIYMRVSDLDQWINSGRIKPAYELEKEAVTDIAKIK
jgi:excisionase family DNA binding protein